jgi:chaperone BCS1
MLCYFFSNASELLLRSEDVGLALRILAEFLLEKGRRMRKETEDKKDSAEEGSSSLAGKDV